MDYIAESKNVKMSPRKVRLVVDSIKKDSLALALSKLYTLNKRAADPVKKVLQSAIANAVNNHKIDRDSLMIKTIMVNEGIKYKRYHYAARGRVRPYVRRSSHIRVVLASKPAKTVQPVEAKKEEAK